MGKTKRVRVGFWVKETGYKGRAEMDGLSVNEGEFKALICAMHHCIETGHTRVIFYSDSRIVINRANGRRPTSKKLRNPRMDYFQDIVFNLAEFFESVKFQWIPREMNEVADELTH